MHRDNVIPTYDEFIEPVLRCLAGRPEGATAAAVCETVADQCGLSNDARHRKLRSGKLQYRHRIRWAHDRLKRAQLSRSVRWGLWCLTEEGRALAESNAGPLPEELIFALATKSKVARLKPEILTGQRPTNSKTAASRLQAALDTHADDLATELLDHVRRLPFERFRQFICDLLEADGSTKFSLHENTGYLVEGIARSPMAPQKFVWAKQMTRAIGAPGVDAFRDAMVHQGLTVGLFISVSDFNKHAERCAAASPAVQLMGGFDLAAEMSKRQVGATLERVEIPRIDPSYFSFGQDQ